jgi:GINS complex subunit 1
MTCIQVRHAALQFNKRTLLSYHYQRLQILKKFRWEFGRELPETIRVNLSDDEKAWFQRYCAILGLYMTKLGDGIDLTLGQKPPKRLYIQVRCVKDFGDYQLDDGTIVVLSRGSTHFLQRSNCEKLIQQGYLEQI